MLCPCGSKKLYLKCCEPFISCRSTPTTPEELMRSRYTAYTQANIEYIVRTMQGRALEGFDPVDAKEWAKGLKWLGLDVLNAYDLPEVGHASVEFKAWYRFNARKHCLHELSEFSFVNGRWYYIGMQDMPV